MTTITITSIDGLKWGNLQNIYVPGDVFILRDKLGDNVVYTDGAEYYVDAIDETYAYKFAFVSHQRRWCIAIDANACLKLINHDTKNTEAFSESICNYYETCSEMAIGDIHDDGNVTHMTVVWTRIVIKLCIRWRR